MRNKNFEKFFDLIYQGSKNKEYFGFHEKRFKVLYNIIKRLSPQKILDVGGSEFTLVLKKMGYNIRSLNKPDCNLEKDSIPYEDNTFDLVIYTEVIEHLSTNYAGSLREIYRILKPGAFILFGTPNKKALWKIFKGSKITKKHIKEFSMQECMMMLQNSGFDILFNRFMSYLEYPKRYPFDAAKGEFDHFIYYHIVKRIPRFQESILILGRKK